MKSSVFLCAPCREVAKASSRRPSCPKCQAVMGDMGTRWRPPRRSNKAAWRLIDAGIYLTERLRSGHNPNVTSSYTVAHPPERTERRSCSEVGHLLAELRDDEVSPSRTRELARHANPDVRLEVVRLTDLDPALVAELTRDPVADVRRAAAKHPNLPSDFAVRSRMLRGPADVRAFLASRGDLDLRTVLRLLRDEHPDVVRTAAGQPLAPVRRMQHVPLGWLPEARLSELESGPRLKLLKELRTGSGKTLTVRDAVAVLDSTLT